MHRQAIARLPDRARLSGQHATVLMKQIFDIRSGQRVHPKMEPFAERPCADAVHGRASVNCSGSNAKKHPRTNSRRAWIWGAIAAPRRCSAYTLKPSMQAQSGSS
jgi:hypothetical protein